MNFDFRYILYRYHPRYLVETYNANINDIINKHGMLSTPMINSVLGKGFTNNADLETTYIINSYNIQKERINEYNSQISEYINKEQKQLSDRIATNREYENAASSLMRINRDHIEPNELDALGPPPLPIEEESAIQGLTSLRRDPHSLSPSTPSRKKNKTNKKGGRRARARTRARK